MVINPVVFIGFKVNAEQIEKQYKEMGNEKDEIRVSNESDFINAISSNKTIILTAGKYDLSKIIKTDNKNVSLEYPLVDEQSSIVISNIRDCCIKGDGTVIIVTPYQYADVLSFANCNKIKIMDLTLKHVIEKGSCLGDVIELNHCEDIEIRNCSLDGCGTYGVKAGFCKDILIAGSRIINCSYGAIEIAANKGTVLIKDNIIIDNKQFDIVNIKSDKIKILNNKISGNIVDCDFSKFIVLTADLVEFQNNTIKGNIGLKDGIVIKAPKGVFKDNLLDDNQFIKLLDIPDNFER